MSVGNPQFDKYMPPLTADRMNDEAALKMIEVIVAGAADDLRRDLRDYYRAARDPDLIRAIERGEEFILYSGLVALAGKDPGEIIISLRMAAQKAAKEKDKKINRRYLTGGQAKR